MADIALKNRIIEIIESTDNEDLLKKILKILEEEKDVDEMYKVQEEEKKAMDKGASQLEKGRDIAENNQIKPGDESIRPANGDA